MSGNKKLIWYRYTANSMGVPSFGFPKILFNSSGNLRCLESNAVDLELSEQHSE
jgi:hypothetical protein